VKHPKQPRQSLRPLVAIENDLQSALRNDTTNILHIGGLLVEAKEQIKRGEWLPWLKAQGSFTDRTAAHYMRAAEYAGKFETVSNLKLRPAALYRLAEREDELSAEVREAVFAAARDHWVNEAEVLEIQNRLQPFELEPKPEVHVPDFETFTAPLAADAETTRGVLTQHGAIAIETTAAGNGAGEIKCSIPKGTAPQVSAALVAAGEAAATLATTAPDLPPPPPSDVSAKDAALNDQYKQAIEILDALATKPVDRWLGLLPPEQVARAADMLRSIVERSAQRAA
jgi:hypothetical protein